MRAETAFQHAVTLYNELDKRAANGVFTGKKTEAFDATGLPRGAYAELFNLLTELGCIEQTARGAANAPSVVALHRPPESVEQVESVYRSRATPLTRRVLFDTVVEDVGDLKRRMPPIDLSRWVLSVEETLRSIEHRLNELEAKEG